MTGRVINPVRSPFTPSSVCLLAAGCLGLCLCFVFGTGSLMAQQSGFQTDGTPIYPALPVPPTGVPPVTSTAPAPGMVPVQPGQPGQPGAPGMAPAPAANPDYPQLVYPPVYSPETVPTRPPKAMPVPEKKGKFGLFGKRKDKGRDDDDVPAQRSMDSEPARVYPDPSTAYPQGQMQSRPGYDPNYAPGAVPPATDAYGRPVNPGTTAATAPQQGMQPRPSLDSRYPVYTTQPAVPPAYPGPGADPGASTLPPLPDSPPSMQSAQPPAYPQMTPAPAPAPTTPPPAGTYGNSGGSLAQAPAPAGPAMPPSDAPIFRREPVLEPAPAPATAPSAGSNAPIFRNTAPSTQTPPVQTPPATGNGSQWETARSGTGPSTSTSGTGLPTPRNETPAPPKPEANEFANLPFAKPVPGKVGFVTVSTYSGEIDVRGIAPGTPVEIPDPSDASKTIQFRVP